MFISISEASVAGDPVPVTEAVERVHEFLRTMPGFRWAMLLRGSESPDALAAVSMWLTPEQASAQESVSLGAKEHLRGFDVTTARGSMTPAARVAVVEWQVPEEDAARFTNRWNAVYHAIEDRIGSRLLRNLGLPDAYAGLHAVTEAANLDAAILGGAVSDADGLSVTPASVRTYDVVLLTEA